MLSGSSSRILKVSLIDDAYRSNSGTSAPSPPPPAPLEDADKVDDVPLSSVILHKCCHAVEQKKGLHLFPRSRETKTS